MKQLLSSYGIEKVGAKQGIEEYRLPNGLKVILGENHAAPVAFVQVIYKVGSKNEGNGHTGATHMLEHLLFKCKYGRFDSDKGTSLDQVLKPFGGVNNASTWLERTNYWELIPKDFIEICLEMEATRMRQLELEKRHRDSEMTVVRSELEIGENDPNSVLWDNLFAFAYKEHPYKIPTIGYRSDVENMPMEALQNFYDQFYYPNNAVLVVMGDFETEQVLEWIAKYYGPLPTSPHKIPEVYTIEPKQQGERRFVIRRAGDKTRIAMGFHVCPVVHKDFYALSVVESILGGHRPSDRLYKALLDTSLSTEATSFLPWLRDPGLFVISCDVVAGKDAKVVEETIYAEIERLKNELVSQEELKRVKLANSKSTRIKSADPRVFGGSFITEAEAAADWQWLVDYDHNFAAVTPQEVQKVVRKYFQEDNRTVGVFIPKDNEEDIEDASEQGALNLGSAAEELADMDLVGLDKLSQIETNTSDELPQMSKELLDKLKVESDFENKVSRKVLPNGLTVLCLNMPQPGVEKGHGCVAITFGIKAGSYAAEKDQDVIPSMVAEILTRGSRNWTKHALSETLQEMGADLSLHASMLNVGGGSALVAEDVERYFSILEDVIRHPTFPQEELTKMVVEYLAEIDEDKDDTDTRAGMALATNLYEKGSLFYPLTFEERESQIKAATVEQLQKFYSDVYSPQGMTMSIVGDIEPEKAFALVEKHFGDWTGNKPKAWEDQVAKLPKQSKRVDVFLKDKENVSVILGHPISLKRDSKEYFAARIANAILGEQTFGSRLGERVRVREGLTYGIGSRLGDRTIDGGPWVVKLNVNPKNVDKAIDCIHDEIAKLLKDGPQEREIAENIGDMSGSFVVRLRTPISVSMALLEYELSGLGLKALDEFVPSMRAVTKQDAWDFLKKNLQANKFVISAAGSHKQ